MTYPELVDFCGSERQAWFLAKQIDYKRLTEDEGSPGRHLLSGFRCASGRGD